MKILLVGSGGREHALAWKMAQSNKVKKIFVAPGNAGTAMQEKCENVALNSITELVHFATQEAINLTVVGPEALLVDGIADAFKAAGLSIFAPNRAGAKLEGSKTYAKEFMTKYGVKTAHFQNFKSHSHAQDYLNMVQYPVVVKASGLAAGKGVIICAGQEEADQALQEIMLHDKFGVAGAEVVIEEFLTGFEASILSVCDSKTILPFISAKDHKKIGEGETGLNTGGMGVIAPNPQLTEAQFREFEELILRPTLQGIQQENIDFVGVIFFGLMVNENGVYLLEYNTRFGDPETQAVLPLLQTDLVDVFEAAIHKQLATQTLNWKEEHSCCVVAVSGGYPEKYEKGKLITIGGVEDSQLFIAGAKLVDGELKTSGGRVLNLVAQGTTLAEAQQKAYDDIQAVSFEKMVYRRDIGKINS